MNKTNAFEKKSSLITCLIILTFASLSFAAEGGEAGEHAGLTPETIRTVIYQAINVALIFAGLIYFLKDGIRKAFAKKREDYLLAAEKAKRAIQDAARAKSELEVRLHQLESTADESLSRAKKEAADLRNQLISEAQNLSKHIKQEAANSASGEIDRAKRQLREELLQESFKIAEQGLAAKVSSDDHFRLQGEFISNIQAVQK